MSAFDSLVTEDCLGLQPGQPQNVPDISVNLRVFFTCSGARRLQHSIATVVTKASSRLGNATANPNPCGQSNKRRIAFPEQTAFTGSSSSEGRHGRAEPQPIPLRLVCCCAA